jgi:hypothetical protein
MTELKGLLDTDKEKSSNAGLVQEDKRDKATRSEISKGKKEMS